MLERFEDRTEVHERAEALRQAARAYDRVNYPGLEHLRPHQSEAINIALDHVANISGETIESPYGVCILEPPGSGKTITAGALVTALTTSNFRPKVVHLTPSHLIQDATKERYETFSPSLDSFVYSSQAKGRTGDVCLMTYQSARHALDAGYIDSLNPDILIADEIHHTIDGEWADAVAEIAQGRYSFGMTATPAYTHGRHIRRLFPEVLVHKTFKEGIEEGFVAPFRSYLYRSKVRYHGDIDGISQDIFAALTIATRYAELGKVGVISCMPGQDRAHARSVASLAELMKVGSRGSLRIRSVDGDMDRAKVDGRLEALKARELDALSYTSLLGEGWDMPELDYMILLASTHSVVWAAQRLGRATRLGKITDVHEFYKPGAITHIDAFDEPFDMLNFREPKKNASHLNDIRKNMFELVPDFAKLTNSARLWLRTGKQLGAEVEQEQIFGSTEPQLSYDWLTKSQLAARTLLSEDEIEKRLIEKSIVSASLGMGTLQREYYPPEVLITLVNDMDIPSLGEDMVELQAAYRALRQKVSTLGSRSTFVKGLEEAGVKPELRLNHEGKPVVAVRIEALGYLPRVPAQALQGVTQITARRQERKKSNHNGSDEEFMMDTAKVMVRKKPLSFEKRIEDFLISLFDSSDVSRDAERDRRDKLARLQVALQDVGTVQSAELSALEEDMTSFKPSGIAMRSLISMGARNKLRPVRVLAAINHVIGSLPSNS